MPPDHPELPAPWNRRPLLWIGAGALILGQLLALGMLCSHQVERGQARQAEQQMQRLALADCLRHTPGATLALCESRGTLHAQLASPAEFVPSALAGGAPVPAVPVGFKLR